MCVCVCGHAVSDFTPTLIMTYSSAATSSARSQRVAGTNLTAATAHYLIKEAALGPAVLTLKLLVIVLHNGGCQFNMFHLFLLSG